MKRIWNQLKQLKQSLIASIIVGVFVCLYTHFIVSSAVAETKADKQQIRELLDESVQLNIRMNSYITHQLRDTVLCPNDTIQAAKIIERDRIVDSILEVYRHKKH